MKNFAPLLGRILLALIFIMAGVGKIMDPVGTQAYMASVGMHPTLSLMIGAIIVEIGGGLSLILGCKARLGASALFLFLIPTTLLFHINFADKMQMILFLKNLGIMGGLLMVASFGPGPFSLDDKCCGEK